jgi:hypothetical protein
MVIIVIIIVTLRNNVIGNNHHNHNYNDAGNNHLDHHCNGHAFLMSCGRGGDKFPLPPSPGFLFSFDHPSKTHFFLLLQAIIILINTCGAPSGRLLQPVKAYGEGYSILPHPLGFSCLKHDFFILLLRSRWANYEVWGPKIRFGSGRLIWKFSTNFS